MGKLLEQKENTRDALGGRGGKVMIYEADLIGAGAHKCSKDQQFVWARLAWRQCMQFIGGSNSDQKKET